MTTALTLRAVFRLWLRQTEGLIPSLLRLLGLDLAAPDHSTMSRRGATLQVSQPPGSGPVHLLVDGTGLKLWSPGEWLVEEHASRTRRSWRKLPRAPHRRICGCRSRCASGSGQSTAWLPSIVPQTGSDAFDRRLADRFCFSPRKSGPDHAVPGIFLAIVTASGIACPGSRSARRLGWLPDVGRPGLLRKYLEPVRR
jgi:hypothetical protein